MIERPARSLSGNAGSCFDPKSLPPQTTLYFVQRLHLGRLTNNTPASGSNAFAWPRTKLGRTSTFLCSADVSRNVLVREKCPYLAGALHKCLTGAVRQFSAITFCATSPLSFRPAAPRLRCQHSNHPLTHPVLPANADLLKSSGKWSGKMRR